MGKEVTEDWVELTPILLAPCKGCGFLLQPIEDCPICEGSDFKLTEDVQDGNSRRFHNS